MTRLEDIDADALKASRKGKKNKNKKPQQQQASISPALAQWAATSASSEKDADAAAFGKESQQPTENNAKGSSRRIKQASRQAVDVERDSKIQALIVQFQETLSSSKPTIDAILRPIRDLLQLALTSTSSSTSVSLRSLIASPTVYHYRLAWVGSDDAVSHVGTGLHKVPLARLQEVFLTLGRGGRVTWMEAIRLLGPFPNIKNELQGECKVTTASLTANKKNTGSDEASSLSIVPADWSITWDSMIDGTGRQVTAGPEVRTVELQVALADSAVIVAFMPTTDGTLRNDPLEAGGKHVLVFVREDELDEKLEALRIA
ncbi:hypothetical protein MPSEU_000040800 [Mayamaea pseudoterrestris]|nr:hypothetical protein MPSEU_000040800 [Mayamaea pseudoterrestris]